ncbi:unnamed protein product [Sphagnum jensenii]|uniref:Uncharacterized protein n=1 Tax=Sphagnum jensenii TaxID=128206 RepID=A0ABP1AXS5_9BRYO
MVRKKKQDNKESSSASTSAGPSSTVSSRAPTRPTSPRVQPHAAGPGPGAPQEEPEDSGWSQVETKKKASGKVVASSSQQPSSGGYGRGNSPQQWDNRSQPRASTFEESRISQGPTPHGNQGDDSRNAPQRGGQAWNQRDRPEDFPQIVGGPAPQQRGQQRVPQGPVPQQRVAQGPAPQAPGGGIAPKQPPPIQVPYSQQQQPQSSSSAPQPVVSMWGSLPSDPSSSSQGEASGFVTTSPPSSPSLLTSLAHKLEETFKIAKDIKDTILGPSLSDLRVPPRPTKPGTAGQANIYFANHFKVLDGFTFPTIYQNEFKTDHKLDKVMIRKLVRNWSENLNCAFVFDGMETVYSPSFQPKEQQHTHQRTHE